ncbi:MAG: energy coupling factor transporter S component ThiW [Candidatus Bathyarchaeia archaeon]
MEMRTVHVKKLTVAIIFAGLGIAISPFAGFLVFGTIANPTQHMINAILGVLLGPFWAVIAAIIIGTTRNMLGIGTLFAFPGGIPGGLVVGSTYWILERFKVSEKTRLTAALTEPIGTLLIGVPIALFVFAPWLGTQSLIGLVSKHGTFTAFLIFGAGWALSCVPGCILAFIVLLILKRVGISRETLFGQK